jgi:hypothetical protein
MAGKQKGRKRGLSSYGIRYDYFHTFHHGISCTCHGWVR